MEALQLNSNEAILRKNTYPVRYKGKSATIYLTNKNLIVCIGNPKKKNAEVTKIKLGDILVNGTNPQVTVIVDENGYSVLTIFSLNGVCQIYFENRSEAYSWHQSIIRAMLGDLDVYSDNGDLAQKDAEKRALSGGFLNRTIFGVTKTLSSVVRSGYDGIKNGLGIQKKVTQEENARLGASILMQRNQNEAIEKKREEERIERAKRALEFENMAAEEVTQGKQSIEDVTTACGFTFCTECGEKLPSGAKFCPTCGTKV